MTFVRKDRVLLYFRIVAICLMMIVLVCFISTVLEDKRPVVSLESLIEKPGMKSKMCMSEYVTYCGFALFLGAFVNVKRIIKLGVV
jgi:hypothetical protein